MSSNINCSEIRQEVYLSGYSVVTVLGLIFNCIALYFLFHLPHSAITIYMKNLAFADLLLIFTLPLRIYGYTLPAEAASSTRERWLCQVTGAFLLLNMYGSIFLLACIAFDRCLAVCYPLRSRRLRQHAGWVCVGVWLFNICACLVSFLPSLSNENQNNNSCLHGQPPFVTKLGPTIGAVISGFLVPAGIITFSSVALLRAMGHSQVVKDGIINKVKVVRMLTANISIFLLCFLPYHIILLLYQWSNKTCSLNEAYHATLLIACFNTVLDPFLYYFTSETMKNAVREVKVGKNKFFELPDLSFEKHKHSVSI
ncbi:lysophosphatidic acid receptor 6-like [Hyperolius riggenbachi]|uniref:lysophosphatidic acid receptor 6-like n=1 Tax=Hyperolius riggenbachi TaxID=752182 RepID=UPI0035A3C2D7